MRWVRDWLKASRSLDRRGMGVRGSIAFGTALMLPAMTTATAFSVEVAHWSAAKVGIQRAADLAAIAGMINYKTSTNYTSLTNVSGAQQTAALFAARMAQINRSEERRVGKECRS